MTGGLERRLVASALALSALAAIALGDVARGTGAAALTLLLASLAMSPVALVVSAPVAVACRAARRKIGVASAAVALAHASWALYRYVDPFVLDPIARLPWLRQGALALAILLALALTSFAPVQRALRIRAWSALHRLVYAAAILAAGHVLGVPFGSVKLGIAAVLLTCASLAARPLALALRRRARSPDPE